MGQFVGTKSKRKHENNSEVNRHPRISPLNTEENNQASHKLWNGERGFHQHVII